MLLLVDMALEVDDQPTLVEGGAPERAADGGTRRAAGAVAADEVVAFEALAPVQPHAHLVACVLEPRDRRAEPCRDGGTPGEAVAQLLLEHGLAEGVAARVAEGSPGRLDAREATAVRPVVVRAVAWHDAAQHRLDHAGGLHGTQRFVVDRNGARLGHRGRMALDERHVHAEHAQQVRQREPGRPGSHDDDGVAHGTILGQLHSHIAGMGLDIKIQKPMFAAIGRWGRSMTVAARAAIHLHRVGRLGCIRCV